MVFEKICALIAEQFSVDADELTMETSFEDNLSADSLDIVELSMALEQEFDIGEMGDEDMSSITTIGDLVRFVQARME